jgi:short-subunit dehydrogenase
MTNILIFGATSAIASACARLWTSQGYSLFLVARNQEKLDSLLDDLRIRTADDQQIAGICADLNQIDDHQRLFDQAVSDLGKLDIVLIAHGSLPDQEACQQSVELTLAEITTNAVSAISLLTIAGNRLESQQSGVIAAISSVAGDRGRQSNYVYGSAKGMVTLFMQGLRNRLAKKGVAVVTIKPGFVDTPMTADIKKGLLWAQPDAIAKGIVNAIDKRKNEVYLPWFWCWIMLIIRNIPETIFKRLSL